MMVPSNKSGGIVLYIHHLTASFGRLNNQTLSLRDGLNVLQAANESGKSTWAAFLSAMLYGISSRDRDRSGFLADKNRFAPWNGAPMQGRMECSCSGRELTLLRQTRRAAAPMAEFAALYAGTGEAVPGLTGQNCGENLLGVPQEVFVRSAFIGQSGLGITADSELEKRIVALVTSGEEDTSYTETAEALRKQLNRRRHNKSGLLPAAQQELEAVRRQLEELEALRARLFQIREQRAALEPHREELERQRTAWKAYEAIRSRRALAEAAEHAETAAEHAEALRRGLEERHIPENETIARLRGAIVNLETTRKSVDRAREARDEALKSRLRAESAVNASPFAGQSAESAKREAAAPPKVRVNLLLPAAAAVALLILPALAGYVWDIPALSYAGCLPAVLTVLLLTRRARAKARAAALQKRFGTADPAEITALADTYTLKLEALSAAQADAAAKSATADALYASLSSNEQGILLEVRRFAPGAFDVPAADAALRESAQRRRELAEAETAARESRARWEVLSQQLPQSGPLTSDELAAQPPERSSEALDRELAELREQAAALQSQADRILGQITAPGDPAALQARAASLEEQVRTLSGEYDALAMALEELERANGVLQNRFSPALGRRAAEIFSELTGGRYSGVALDRSFRLSAEPTGDPISRSAQFLSAGAADQLYLAVRLAICQLVLPEKAEIPLVLDDALANFDDERCALALRWLRREADRRQVLLFTCHSREAEFFQNDPAVFVQELTNSPGQV